MFLLGVGVGEWGQDMEDNEVARDELGKQVCLMGSKADPIGSLPEYSYVWTCPSRVCPHAMLLRHRDKHVMLSDLKNLKFWGKEKLTEAVQIE